MTGRPFNEVCTYVAIKAGADLFGVADLRPFKNQRAALPADLLSPYTRAVSIAIRLDHAILEAIADAPTPGYAQHYRAVNAALDHAATLLAHWIIEQGFRASAIPASQIVDEQNLRASLSHKAVARMAGMGWLGKSLLLVSPEYGPRIRLATVLTDMPLEPGHPVKNRCGACDKCARACPASAIKDVRTTGRYATRDHALHFERCVEQTLLFSAMPAIGTRICGVCVKACPFGRPRTPA